LSEAIIDSARIVAEVAQDLRSIEPASARLPPAISLAFAGRSATPGSRCGDHAWQVKIRIQSFLVIFR
jgi:hypothetical protein